ncbi:MAG: TraR/DksA family transcriptional regulator [Vicinamibacterales bacterium]
MTRHRTGRRTAAGHAADPRRSELRQMLEERRRQLVDALRGRIREAREDASEAAPEVRDEAEWSQVESQDDLEFALMEMKSETLGAVEDALARLEAGTYGRCRECGDEIAETRLRALPFATRCRKCEQSREATAQQDQWRLRRATSTVGFSH